MKTEESLYIKILSWIYSKEDIGFTFEDLETEFKLTDSQSIWIKRVFYHGSSEERLWEEVSSNKLMITGKGIAAILDYLELKDARDSSKEAKTLAIYSIWISILIGFISLIFGAIQILGTQDVKISNFPPIQKVSLPDEKIKLEVSNFPKIQSVWVNNIKNIQ